MRWKKNLYENHGLPDNYTDITFLEQLRKNIKLNNVTVTQAISLGAEIVIRMNIVILFVIIFIWLNNEWTTPSFIFISGVVFTIVGYLIYSSKVVNTIARFTKDSKTVFLFLIFGYILSPILKTLTETISTDTIYAMAILMFLVHLIFSKYGTAQISLSESLSKTSSILGSLMLASRLATAMHAFALLTVAVQCFVLLPFLLSELNMKMVVSSIFTFSTLYFLLSISHTLAYVFVIAIGFIEFVCPLWYVRCQKYKDNIYGPWDEAVIN